MPRTAARTTQAEIARAIRAARAEGVQVVEISEGKIRLVLASGEASTAHQAQNQREAIGEKRKVVL
jgi:hypothetical protein